jgi:hypothetical protein
MSWIFILTVAQIPHFVAKSAQLVYSSQWCRFFWCHFNVRHVSPSWWGVSEASVMMFQYLKSAGAGTMVYSVGKLVYPDFIYVCYTFQWLCITNSLTKRRHYLSLLRIREFCVWIPCPDWGFWCFCSVTQANTVPWATSSFPIFLSAQLLLLLLLRVVLHKATHAPRTFLIYCASQTDF